MITANAVGVAVSSRIRLARNLNGTFFPSVIKSTPLEREIVTKISSLFTKMGGFEIIFMEDLSEARKAALIERYVISPALCDSEGGAVAISRDGCLSVMLCEEDHLREQCLVKGLNFEQSYKRVASLDKLLSNNLRFARDERGYLTACPTNLGTGLRASVMLFLPSLTKAYEIDSLKSMAKEKGLTVRGAYGEGSFADGYLYQVSNDITLGVSEAEIISEVQNFVLTIAENEMEERLSAYNCDKYAVEDRSLRSLGILSNARILYYGEFSELISDVKLGSSLGFIACDSPHALDDLTVSARDNCLAEIFPNQRSEICRAEYVRNALKKINCKAK